MSDFFDRDGRSLDMASWGMLMEDWDYKRIAATKFYGTWVSTVWLGLDHQYGDGPPLIFETMVFPSWSMSELDCLRYGTLRGARVGHQKMVGKHLHRWQHRLAAAVAVAVVVVAWVVLWSSGG